MRKILTSLQLSLTRSSRGLGLAALIGLAPVAALVPQPLAAQGLFSPAITVNGDVITRYELEQRARMMHLLNAPGDPATMAREALIEDRLKAQVAKTMDIAAAPEDVQKGFDDMAKRANMSTDEFLEALRQGGVDQETVRDFIKSSLLWRNYIGTRYGARARPTPAEIDRAISQAGQGGGLQVLLSEIIIPVTPQTLDQVDTLAQEISQITSADAFSAAAAQYSASDSRAEGGRLDWLSLSQLPPSLQPVIMGLKTGDVSDPVMLPNAVALFQMRGLRETGAAAARFAKIDYAAYYIAGGRSPEALSTAERIKQTADTCDDLYGIAKGQPPEVLDRESQAPGQIPHDIALELAKLDPGEFSTALTRNNGQTLVLLMLCSRTPEVAADVTKDQVGQSLLEQRLQSYAQSLLAQLKADALIEEQ